METKNKIPAAPQPGPLPAVLEARGQEAGTPNRGERQSPRRRLFGDRPLPVLLRTTDNLAFSRFSCVPSGRTKSVL